MLDHQAGSLHVLGTLKRGKRGHRKETRVYLILDRNLITSSIYLKKKIEKLQQQQILQGLEKLRVEETNERWELNEFAGESCKLALRNRGAVLVSENAGNTFEHTVIEVILKAAGDDRHQENTCIKTAIQKEKDQLALEVCKLEVKMLRKLYEFPKFRA